ncbi:MAG: WD40 repeat domain-containing protein, partial [Ilumatobacteraceae bacterium]
TDLSAARVVVVTGDRMLLLDAETGAELATGDLEPGSAVSAVAAGSTDDAAVLSATASGELERWRRNSGALVADGAAATPEQVGRPRRLVLSADGRRALVIGDTGSALLNLATGTIESLDVGVTGIVATDPSGRFAAVGGGRLTVWDLATGQRAFAVPEPANALAWSGRCDTPAGCRLVSAGESLDVWDPGTGRRIQLADQTNAQAVAISGDGATVVTAGWGATVAVWRLSTETDDSGRQILAPAGRLTSVDPGTGTIATYDGESTVEVIGAGSTVPIDTGSITRLVLAGGDRLLATDGEGEWRLWDTASAQRVALDPHCSGDRIAVSPGGTRLVTHRTESGETVVCDTSSGTIVARAIVRGSTAPADAVAVDDGGNVVLGGGDGFVGHYPLAGTAFASGVAVDVRFGGEPVEGASLALRDGTIAAGIRPAGGRRGVARVLVWDVSGGGTPVQFDTDNRLVPAVGLLGAGADLVVVAGADDDGGPVTLQVWEADTRRRLGRALGGLAGEVVTLGGDVSALVGVDAGGGAFTWSLDTDPTREICAIVGRPLLPDEWETIAAGALASQPYRPVCS